MLIGLIFALIWPRLGIAAAWSTAGVSLLTALGTAIVATDRPLWIGKMPQQLAPQLATILFLVAIGVLLQWKTRRPAHRPRDRRAIRCNPRDFRKEIDRGSRSYPPRQHFVRLDQLSQALARADGFADLVPRK